MTNVGLHPNEKQLNASDTGRTSIQHKASVSSRYPQVGMHCMHHAAFVGSLDCGDVVFLTSATSDTPYIALVQRVGRTSVTCRRFYRSSDLPLGLKTQRKGQRAQPGARTKRGLAPSQSSQNELFLASVSDSNSRSKVLGRCTVLSPVEYEQHGGDQGTRYSTAVYYTRECTS